MDTLGLLRGIGVVEGGCLVSLRHTLELSGDPVDQLGGEARPRVALRGVKLRPDEAGGDAAALYCQTAPLEPVSRPTKKQSICTFSPGSEASIWRSGGGSSGLRS
jgi:hypothetical protein